MKTMLLLASLLFAVSCSHSGQTDRKIASVGPDLTGTYLGVADYGKGHPGPNKPAIRIYFKPIENEAGKYNVVILEYVDLLRMAPSYIISNKLPFIAKKVGYLNHISNTIAAYEANPGAKEGTLELWPLVVSGKQIVAKKDGKPRIFALAENFDPANPIAGATISSVNEDEPKEIFFPSNVIKKRAGIQYGTAKLAYEKAKLESTWRMNYLRGPYLSQYHRKDDVVLNLGKNSNGDTASFVINDVVASRMSEKKRIKMFTNPKSAFLKGDFAVSEPRDGMFLFHSENADQATDAIVKNKIGLFLDVFDASKSLGQDVVELALVDSENPSDFLMYYEHPDNGEGSFKEE
jgi:hypothetical protein